MLQLEFWHWQYLDLDGWPGVLVLEPPLLTWSSQIPFTPQVFLLQCYFVAAWINSLFVKLPNLLVNFIFAMIYAPASMPLLFIDGPKFHHLNFWYAVYPGAAACILLSLVVRNLLYPLHSIHVSKNKLLIACLLIGRPLLFFQQEMVVYSKKNFKFWPLLCTLIHLFCCLF